MCTATTVPTLVATFTNDRLGLCANVRELSESEEFEVAVVDDVVVSRSFSTKEVAVKTAETLIDIGSLQGESLPNTNRIPILPKDFIDPLV
jgi:hypothetical protein